LHRIVTTEKNTKDALLLHDVAKKNTQIAILLLDVAKKKH